MTDGLNMIQEQQLTAESLPIIFSFSTNTRTTNYTVSQRSSTSSYIDNFVTFQSLCKKFSLAHSANSLQ